LGGIRTQTLRHWSRVSLPLRHGPPQLFFINKIHCLFRISGHGQDSTCIISLHSLLPKLTKKEKLYFNSIIFIRLMFKFPWCNWRVKISNWLDRKLLNIMYIVTVQLSTSFRKLEFMLKAGTFLINFSRLESSFLTDSIK
jgi:hypothetical protein